MKRLLYIFLIVLLLSSCKKNDVKSGHNDMNGHDSFIYLTDKEFASIAFDSPEELTADSAKNILIRFIESEQNHHLSTKSESVSTINLIERQTIGIGKTNLSTKFSDLKKDSISTSFYIFEINNGQDKGMAIVSGDERSPALIAYIPRYDETLLSVSGAGIMIENAKASHLSDILYIETLKDSLRESTYAKISKTLNIPVQSLSYDTIKDRIRVIDGENFTKSSPITNPPSRVYSFVYPLIYTKWNQTAPYNCKHPDIVIDKNNGDTGKPYAGCVEVAVAQVFAYCEVPTFRAQGPAVNWMLLKEKPKITTADPLATQNMIGNLMLEIFQKAGGYYSWDENGIHDGTPTPSTKFVPYIKSIISTGAQQTYNWTIVQNSLTALQPVIIWGDEHCWILDGYAVCKKVGSAGSSRYDTYVTANLGWGGTNDGYYKLNDSFHTDFNGIYNTTEQKILPYCKLK